MPTRWYPQEEFRSQVSVTDTHLQVISKGAEGLGIDVARERLSLLVSNCLVRDAPLASGKPWTLGNYTMEFGGVQVRGRRTFGIYVPIDVYEEEEFDIEKRDMEDMEVIVALYVQKHTKQQHNIHCTSILLQSLDNGKQYNNGQKRAQSHLLSHFIPTSMSTKQFSQAILVFTSESQTLLLEQQRLSDHDDVIEMVSEDTPQPLEIEFKEENSVGNELLPLFDHCVRIL